MQHIPTSYPGAASMPEDLAAYAHDLARRELSRKTRSKRTTASKNLAASVVAAGGMLTSAAVLKYLADGRGKGWSAKTHDNELDSLRDFGRFLKERHAGWIDCIEPIRKAQRETPVYGGEVTGVRAFTLEEQRGVIAAAAEICEKKRAQLKRCSNRDWVYRLFPLTGLRWDEMRHLPWSAVYIDVEPFKILCDRTWNKNRRYQEIALNPEAVEVLRAQRAFTGEGKRVWATMPTLRTLERDMIAAKVRKIDARGRSAAFHSFRKFMNTEGARCGMAAEVRMRLMRHSDPRLTLGTYADVLTPDMVQAVAKLPRLGGILGPTAKLLTSCPQPQNGPMVQNLTNGSDFGQYEGREASVPPHLEPSDHAFPHQEASHSPAGNMAPDASRVGVSRRGRAGGIEWSRRDSNPSARPAMAAVQPPCPVDDDSDASELVEVMLILTTGVRRLMELQAKAGRGADARRTKHERR